MSHSTSYLDTPKVRQYITNKIKSDPQVSNSTLANEVSTAFGVPTSERSIRRARQRWDIDPAPSIQGERPRYTQENDDKIEIVGKPTVGNADPDDLIRQHNLNPEDWEITNIKINRWNAMTGKDQGNKPIEMCQITLSLARKKPLPAFLTAARTDGPSYRTHKVNHNHRLPTTVVLVGDQQAPFHDETLHELFCQWLEVNRPTKGVLVGDTVDFPDISRHRFNPERSARVQQCLNAGYRVLSDYRESSIDTQWVKMPGNHDERIRNTLIDWAVELYGVTRATIDESEYEPPVLGVEHLLRLDELGIDYIDPDGQYDQAQINLSPYLAVRHGWLAVKGSGATALKTLEHLGYSIVVGHSHRQSIVHHTKHDIDGTPSTLVGVETGCMCNIDGLGYSVAPDWQNGFATATIWPDGTFKIDLATYFDGILAYRDQRYGELTK